MPKKLKIFGLKMHEDVNICKTKPENFLNKGTKYKTNYMEGQSSKNKILKVADPLKEVLRPRLESPWKT